MQHINHSGASVSDTEEYEFWIDAYSPQTISMKRLGEYMARLGKLLGQEDRVHFLELRGGSTALAMNIEREAIPKVKDRIDNIKRAEASNDAMFAQKELNDMLRSDNAIGEFRHIIQGARAPMLRFAGREIPKPQKIGPFTQPAIFKGELVRLEGKDSTKHAGIMDSQGRVWSGNMSLELAVHMRELLFEWVLVEGLARWIRTEDGTWDVVDFHIDSCQELPKDNLGEDIKNLRAISGNNWKEMQDPIGFIRESRHDDDEIH